MDLTVVAVLHAFGGSARWHQLKGKISRRTLARAVADGLVSNNHRGTYALVATDRPYVIARRQRGVLTHSSAAGHHKLALSSEPDAVHVTVGHKCRRTAVPDGVKLHFRDVPAEDLDGLVTTVARTVLDCARDLPLADALAVGDSALRQGKVTHAELTRRAAALRGPGSARVRAIVRGLDARAANGFESTMRAILIDGGVEGFVPQVDVRAGGRWLGRVDLAHRTLRIAIECESFEWHGDRKALARDCRRCAELTAHGWTPLRFAWEQVMFEPEWVLAVVRATVAGGTGLKLPAGGTGARVRARTVEIVRD